MSSRLSDEQIRAEVDRVAHALGTEPPSVIEVPDKVPWFNHGRRRVPRLEDGGDKLVLHPGWCWLLGDVREMVVWTLLKPDLKNHENPFVRHPNRYDVVLLALMSAGFIPICFPLISFSLVPLIVRMLSLFALLGFYLFAQYYLGRYKAEYARIVGEAMLKTRNWSAKSAHDFMEHPNRGDFDTALIYVIVYAFFGIYLLVLFSSALFSSGFT